MNFERHTDIKKAVGIGRTNTALKIYGLDILMAGPDRKWHKFNILNKINLPSFLNFLNKKEVSKEEMINLIINRCPTYQDRKLMDTFTKIKFEVKFFDSAVRELQEKGVTSFNTVQYQSKMYDVIDGRYDLV